MIMITKYIIAPVLRIGCEIFITVLTFFTNRYCCNDPNCSFGGRRITRKYERNKATRKSCSVTGQDAHIRYSPYVARLPLERVTMTSKRDSAIQRDNT